MVLKLKSKTMKILRELSLSLIFFLWSSLSLWASLPFEISLDEFKAHANSKDLLGLQVSLPKDIADFLNKDSDFSIKPIDETKSVLRNKKPLKREYHLNELTEICQKLDSEYYISGSIFNNVKYILVEIRIFSKKNNKVFSFQIEGYRYRPGNLALQAFMTIRNYFAKKRFTKVKIPPPAKLLLISNLADEKVNLFAIEMLRKGYRFSSNGFATFNPFLSQEIELFRNFQSASNSLVKIKKLGKRWQHYLVSNLKKNSTSLEKAIIENQKIQNSYSNYRSSVLEKITKLGEASQANFLVIIYIDKDKEKSFARGYDLRKGDLVWLQDSFLEKSDNIRKTTAIISREMLKSVKTKIWKPKKRRTTINEESNVNTSKKNKGNYRSKETEDKAVVAIINFYDNTKSQNFSWLSVSLADSINDSMQNKFIYKRAKKGTIQKKTQEILKGKFDLKKDTKEELLRKIEVLGTDYLIFGRYTFDKIEEVINIEAKVFNLFTKKQIGKAFATSKTDMSLFINVDLVVDKIVKDIYKFAISQESKQVDKEVEEKPQQKKDVKAIGRKYLEKKEDPLLVSLRDKAGFIAEKRFYNIEVKK